MRSCLLFSPMDDCSACVHSKFIELVARSAFASSGAVALAPRKKTTAVCGITMTPTIETGAVPCQG
jgi:hypothetical protein